MAAALAASPPPLCKHWARNKSCLYHSKGKCKFDHPETVDISQIPRQKKQYSKGGRKITRNDTRVAKFRAFVASHVDLTTHHVLDVAGGKGEMAFQVANLCNAASVHVVDPRPLSLARFQSRLQRGFYHRSASIFLQDVVTQQGDPERPVGHLRCFFSHELWQKDAVGEESKDLFETNCNDTKAWSWPPKPNHNHHESNTDDTEHVATGHVEDCDDDTASDDTLQTPSFQHASAITKRATLIVGMHPDQAAEPIVDAALALGISFFVVPCCTYSQEFPNRKLNGKLVTAYQDLLLYLQNKSPDIQRQVLPFEGKNVCLYRIVE